MRNFFGGIAILAAVTVLAGCGDSTPPPQPTATLYVANRSAQTISYLYVALSSASVWGNDRLGSGNTLAPGGIFPVYDLACPETYNLRASTGLFGSTVYAESLDTYYTCGDHTWTIP